MHTPGPWTLGDPADKCPQRGKGGERVHKVVVDGFGGGLVADVSAWWYDTETARDNARLIAAAPDLLAALRDAAFLLRKAGINPNEAASMADSLKRSAGDAEAAIAKAEGRQP